MSLKHGLQFLDALRHFFPDHLAPMRPKMKAEQILRFIVILDAVKVVDYPAFRQWPAMSLFPNKKVLPHVTSRICPWMLRHENHDITAARLESAPFPIWMSSTLEGVNSIQTMFPSVSIAASYAPFGLLRRNHLAAVNAMLWRKGSCTSSAFSASFRPLFNWLAAIRTRVPMSPAIMEFGSLRCITIHSCHCITLGHKAQ